jgi:hypothetical protein
MDLMRDMNRGATKVGCSDHTLLLGWNECTCRCVCQIALLRSTFLKENETWARRLFPWLRVRPSSPVAAAPVVILCNTMTKEEMDNVLRDALLGYGISPHRTKVGFDVICRVGDPCDPHDLLRVGAHRAKSILVMMTIHDEREAELTKGVLKAASTLRTLLALRCVLFENKPCHPGATWNDMRIVLHLDNHIGPEINAAKFSDPAGADIVFAIELSAFTNSLLFNCSHKPGMSSVFMELISFEGFAFRCKSAKALGLVGKTFGECSLIWAQAVVVGVVDMREPLEPDVGAPDEGIACVPEREITEHDAMIFIAKNTFPKPAGKFSEGKELELEEVPECIPKTEDILVCGWRQDWFDALEFRSLISDLAHGLQKGSRLEFLNSVEADKFREIMKDAGFEMLQRGDNGRLRWNNNGIFITHWHGDPCNGEILYSVLSSTDNTLESAVIMGSAAGEKVENQTRDMRVMSTMLLLRQVFAELFPHSSLHVVGENCVDATSDLAVTPLGRNVPDFVNMQAIYARALAMALTYPLAQPAIAQLFHRNRDLPYLKLAAVGKEVIPTGPATFAQVTRAVKRRNSDAVCIGYLTHGGERVFAPHPSKSHNYQDGDFVLIFDQHQEQDFDQLVDGDSFRQTPKGSPQEDIQKEDEKMRWCERLDAPAWGRAASLLSNVASDAAKVEALAAAGVAGDSVSCDHLEGAKRAYLSKLDAPTMRVLEAALSASAN